MSGLVSLVGAGPGDPDLLTRRAAQRLAEADLVLYDALVDPAVLELAGHAQRFYVGKRVGRHHVTQEQIHRILIRAAQRGQRVVRLKGGDPFVFGRGGEEALALAEAGIAFEVVPGISSSVAAPALAGIPVTHRGMSTGFVVVSGHADEAWQPALDSLAPGAVTVVVLMGLAHRGAIAARLLERGWSAQTPAAIVWAASRAEGSTWRGNLAELALSPVAQVGVFRSGGSPLSPSADSLRARRSTEVEAEARTPIEEAPGTIVVGSVVSLAEALAPAASHPLTAAGGSR
jgi:uroporphyrin-III C-methyltransferase/precorrin-2 dehydrogenase/sirohydrochlorin ferrochelatase